MRLLRITRLRCIREHYEYRLRIAPPAIIDMMMLRYLSRVARQSQEAVEMTREYFDSVSF